MYASKWNNNYLTNPSIDQLSVRDDSEHRFFLRSPNQWTTWPYCWRTCSHILDAIRALKIELMPACQCVQWMANEMSKLFICFCATICDMEIFHFANFPILNLHPAPKKIRSYSISQFQRFHFEQICTKHFGHCNFDILFP